MMKNSIGGDNLSKLVRVLIHHKRTAISFWFYTIEVKQVIQVLAIVTFGSRWRRFWSL